MTIIDTDADRALKMRHRAMWASGDYPLVVTDVVHPLGAELVELAGVGSADRVLDVGAGTGSAAIPAAHIGATVTATDLTPELLETGRASVPDLPMTWTEADAEHLPFADESFDVVLSTIGVMFAPHHQLAADELVRVCRPDGTIALTSWTPEGFIGQLFLTMKPFALPAPAGAQPAPLWGSPGHLAELFGDRVEVLHQERRMLPVSRFESGEAFRDFFRTNYGPTISVYGSLGDDVARIAALDDALETLANGPARSEWEYLVTVMRRR